MRATMRMLTSSALFAMGGIHLAWAAGSTFPMSDERSLARAVTGDDAMPPTLASAVVGVGLCGLAVISATAGPERPWRRRLSKLAAGALAVRALVPSGPLMSTLGLPDPAPEFVELDRRLYRPLCLALAVGLLGGARRRK